MARNSKHLLPLSVSGNQGPSRGLAKWFKLTHMVFGRFHFPAGIWLEASVPCHVDLSHGAARVCLRHGSWLPPEWMLPERGRVTRKKITMSSVTWLSLLLYSVGHTDQTGTGGDFTMVWISKHDNYWGPTWMLTTNVSLWLPKQPLNTNLKTMMVAIETIYWDPTICQTLCQMFHTHYLSINPFQQRSNVTLPAPFYRIIGGIKRSSSLPKVTQQVRSETGIRSHSSWTPQLTLLTNSGVLELASLGSPNTMLKFSGALCESVVT